MTICLGALCEQGAGNPNGAVVVASDRMVTLGNLIEFEHAVPKMTVASTQVVMLIAGDALAGNRLVTETCAESAIQGLPVAEIAKKLATNYAAVRTEEVEAQYLTPRGLSFETFHDKHTEMQQQVVFGLDQA